MLTICLSLKILTSSASMAELARKRGMGVERLKTMVSDGTRLLYLSLCSESFFPSLLTQSHHIIGSPYILSLFAILRQKRRICKQAITNDISSIGTYLRRVPGKSSHLFLYWKSIMNFIQPRQWLWEYDKDHTHSHFLSYECRVSVLRLHHRFAQWSFASILGHEGMW